jgi:endonuclease YncB( thermonuclease family)
MFRKLLFLSLFFSFSVYSQDTNSVTVSRIISVYDGDTFRVDIDELSDIVGKNIAIRILGIDTPEIKGKCDKEKQLAIKARDFTRSYLNNASSVQLSNLKRDKYFRLLADVYVDGESLAAALLANDLAVIYSGKKKLTWC